MPRSLLQLPQQIPYSLACVNDWVTTLGIFSIKSKGKAEGRVFEAERYLLALKASFRALKLNFQ
jgi:hypothetical protein